MNLPPTIHVAESRSPKPPIFGLLKPPAQRLLLATAQAPWLTKKPAQFALEYDNPDLTQPSRRTKWLGSSNRLLRNPRIPTDSGFTLHTVRSWSFARSIPAPMNRGALPTTPPYVRPALEILR